jgi:glutamine synthetase
MSNPKTITEWEKSVEFVQIRYTDVPGKFLARYLSTPADIEGFFRNGMGLDGSSVRGFAHIDDSDLLLLPDISTARTVPISKERMIGTVVADVYKGFAQGRLNTDPRYASQRMQKYLEEKNMLCQLGPEVECFILDEIKFGNGSKQQDTSIISSEQEAYGSRYPIMRRMGYDCPPFQDSLLGFRFEVAEILKKYYSFDVTNVNHEVASGGQIEINFNHSASLTQAADSVQVFKDAVRNTAKNHGKIATFMPKPFFDENNSSKKITEADNGSGMHVNISIWEKDGRRNLFYDPDDAYAELSQIGRYFVGGILEHASSLSAIVAPTINSYQRLVPGFEAPVYVAWARGNRSTIIRVPAVERNSARSKRVEFRAPDPSANPYLALSAVVAAGMDGIAKKIEPGEPVNENIYKLSESRKKALGIKPLPSSLEQALSTLMSDSHYLLQSCFTSDLLQSYLELKAHEIKEGKGKGRSWQIRRYYDV